MARQQVNFLKSTNPDAASPGDGLDTGSTDASAVRPVADGQTGTAAVFARPSENLRSRTEIIRTELENLKYLSDADRALLLTSTGNITWNGLPTGTFSTSADINIKPFMAPSASTASRLIICAGTVGQITIRSRQNGVAGQPRAYKDPTTGISANDYSFDFTPVTTGTGAIVITLTGAPATRFHIQYDDHAVSGTTVNAIPGNSFLTQFNSNALIIAAGLEAVVEGGGSPVEVGFPVPPASVAGTLLGHVTNGIQVAERATRFMSGAADAEKHTITQAHLTAFFGVALNTLIEGDVLCIQYDELIKAGNGGRRQSIGELPEDKAKDAGLNLFLLRRFPQRLPVAIPVATVVNGKLVFINGRVYNSGEIGPVVSSGATYQGSPASPNSWADNTTVGPSDYETALDTVIQTLGARSGTSGAGKVGTTAVTGPGPASFSTTATSVQTNITDIVNEMNVKPSLGITNTFTNANTFAPIPANTTAITATGSGTGRGISATGGATGTGVRGQGGSTVGIGVEGYGVGTTGVFGQGGNGSPPGILGIGGPTDGIGVSGYGSGTGAGVSGAGGSSGGAGVTGSSGTAASARGVIGTTNAEGGFGIEGVVGATPTNGFGVVGAGKGNGPGVRGTGGGTGPSDFATRIYGAGVTAYGGALGNAMGVVGQGGSVSTPGTRPETFANVGVLGVGTGSGSGVVGVSANASLAAGVEGFGSTGNDTIGVKGTGVNGGYGVWGVGGSTGGSGVYGEGIGAGGNGGTFFAPSTGIGVSITGNDRWDLTTMEGDFRIGNFTTKLKMGVALTGGTGTAGDARIAAVGGVNTLSLGAGTTTADQRALILSSGNAAVKNDFQYQAARTFVHHVPLGSFQVGNATAFTPRFTSSSSSYWDNLTGGAENIESAVFGIPAGATLTGVRIHLQNSSGSSKTFPIDLRKEVYDAAGSYTRTSMLTAGAPVSLVVADTLNQWFDVGIGASQTFPTDGWVAVQLQFPNAATGSLRFRGIRISYTTVNLVPAS